LTEEALKLIDQRDPDRPFYLNLWHYAVHQKHEAKPELVEKYARKIKELGIEHTFRLDPKTGSELVTSEDNAVYAAMIDSLDQSIGRIVDRLKRDHLYENTLFVFYSDNGPVTDVVPCPPLNGGKNSTYEAGERVPAFVTWPGRVKAGKSCEAPISIADMFFTVLDAAGIAPPNRDRDGNSLLPYFQGGTIPAREFFWYFPDSRPHWGQRANAALRSRDGFKYVMFFNGDPDELYNLNTDLAEAHDLIGQRPEEAEAMRKRLVSLLAPFYSEMPPPTKKFREGVEDRLGIKPASGTDN
jgi:arylsulfatase A-like enzyme